jgi:hypothetical protein
LHQPQRAEISSVLLVETVWHHTKAWKVKNQTGHEVYESKEGGGYHQTPVSLTHTAQAQSAKTQMADAAKTQAQAQKAKTHMA